MTRFELNEHPSRGFDGAFHDWQKITVERPESLRWFFKDPNRFTFNKVITDHVVWLYNGDHSWLFMDHTTYKHVMKKLHDELDSIKESDPRLHPKDPDSCDLWWSIQTAKEIEKDPLMGLPFCPGDRMHVPMGSSGRRQIEQYVRNVRLNHPEALFRMVTANQHIWLYRDTDSGLIPEKFVRLYKC